MIQLYGSPRTSAGRVYWMLEELGMSYQVMPMDLMRQEHKSDAYLKINPNGKVPTLIDEGQILWESMAINTYLAEKYNSPLKGQNPTEVGLIQQWSYWAILELQKPLVDWLIQEVFTPTEKKQPELIEKSKQTIAKVLPILDQSLKDKSFLVSNRFTLADLNVASVVNIANALKYDYSNLHNVTRWFRACADRPAFQKLMQLRSAK